MAAAVAVTAEAAAAEVVGGVAAAVTASATTTDLVLGWARPPTATFPSLTPPYHGSLG